MPSPYPGLRLPARAKCADNVVALENPADFLMFRAVEPALNGISPGCPVPNVPFVTAKPSHVMSAHDCPVSTCHGCR